MYKHETQNTFCWTSSESKNGGAENWPIDRILQYENFSAKRLLKIWSINLFQTLCHFLISTLIPANGTIINHCLKM